MAHFRGLASNWSTSTARHEGRALLEPDRQRGLLDAFGGLEDKLLAYRRARAEHDGLRRKRLALIEATEARQRERALLEFERDELAAADPRTGEYDELVRESHLLANAEHSGPRRPRATTLLYEADHSAQEILKRVARSLGPLADSVPELAEAAATLDRLADETREVAYALRNLGQSGTTTRSGSRRSRPGWHSTEARGPVPLLARRAGASQGRDRGQAGRDRARRGRPETPGRPACRRIPQAEGSSGRSFRGTPEDGRGVRQGNPDPAQAAGPGQGQADRRGRDPGPGRRPDAPSPPETGADRVEMLFLPNPGEVPRPLRKIASGGELSRVTLAAKTVLACTDRVATLVLDEVDTGVGGRLGAALGKTLAELAGIIRSSASRTCPRWRASLAASGSSASKRRGAGRGPRSLP